MQIASIATDRGPQFAVGAGGGWVTFADLGVTADDLPAAIAAAGEIGPRLAENDPAVRSDVELLCPVVRPGKILAIGLNYLDHIRETGATPPPAPVVFAKYPSSLNGPYAPIVMDSDLTSEGDYESELAVVIGTRCRRVPADDALSVIFGYAVANDVSARDWQRADPQFSRSKSFDTFCPIGPWITTSDMVADPQQLRITSTVNGEKRQDSSTSEMLFGIRDLIAYLSRTMTLEPGDVILTGTPHGVGIGRTPPSFLQPGDVVECSIDGLGTISNPVVGPEAVAGR